MIYLNQIDIKILKATGKLIPVAFKRTINIIIRRIILGYSFQCSPIQRAPIGLILTFLASNRAFVIPQ
jgi:hypothetical protein